MNNNYNKNKIIILSLSCILKLKVLIRNYLSRKCLLLCNQIKNIRVINNDYSFFSFINLKQNIFILEKIN